MPYILRRQAKNATKEKKNMFKLTLQKRKDFGNLLRECRKKSGLTLQQVEKIVDYKFGLLAYMERGANTKLKIVVIERLCQLYGLDIDKTCISLGKIPTRDFYKIIKHPELLEVIRKYKAKV